MDTIRHFTATGYLVHQNYVYLHWHKKVSMWLPPGGHIEENEDPVQAVSREVFEETGIESVILGNEHTLSFKYPKIITAPRYIMEEDIDDLEFGPHKHIDFIYYCRPKNGVEKMNDGWISVNYDDLQQGNLLTVGENKSVSLTEDVRQMSMEAIETNLDSDC